MIRTYVGLRVRAEKHVCTNIPYYIRMYEYIYVRMYTYVIYVYCIRTFINNTVCIHVYSVYIHYGLTYILRVRTVYVRTYVRTHIHIHIDICIYIYYIQCKLYCTYVYDNVVVNHYILC